MKNWTIRARMAFWYAVTILAFLAILFAVLYATLIPAINQAIRQRVIASGEAVAENVDFDDGRFEIDDDVVPADTFFTVYSRDGMRALSNHAHEWFENSPFEPNSIHEVTEDGQTWLLYDTPLNEKRRLLGYVRTGAPLGVDADTMRGLFMVFGITAPACVIVAILTGMFIAKKSLAPINKITVTASEISSGDLTKRLSLPATKDEVGRLAGTFNEMLESLEGAFEREKQFTSDASHELRTPLAVIIGACQTALKADSSDEYRDCVRMIYKKSTQMQSMLSQMLLLARGSEQRKAMEITDVNLSYVVADISEEFQSAAAAKGITIVTDIRDDVVIRGDLMMITRAVMNLVDNGIKYGKQNGLLELSLEEKDSLACIRVKDNGGGIPPESRPKVFDRFYQADPSRSSEGSGLGLALVRRIAQLHDGSVTAQSSGETTVFELCFPFLKRSA